MSDPASGKPATPPVASTAPAATGSTATPPSASGAPATAGDPFIVIDDFAKVVLKTGEVLACENHPNADKLLKLTVKIGAETRTICAGIKAWWKPEDLVGKTIVVVANLAPRMMRGVESQGMLLAVQDGDQGDVIPLTVMKPAPSGLRAR